MDSEIIRKKLIVQKDAHEAWIRAGRRGSLQLITGMGKTKIFLDAVKSYPKNAKIIFLAEVTDRERELRAEQKKWGMEDCNIEFACYQTACKWVNREFDLACSDEGDESFTPVYSQFYFNNKIKDLMCLFAYLDTHLVVGEENGRSITKGELCNRIAPICFTYGMKQGQAENTSRHLDIYVIKHKLDDANKNMEAGNKYKKWMQTEKQAYDYADGLFKKAWENKESHEDFMVKRTAGMRANVLYNLPSKVVATNELLFSLQDKTIIFGNSLSALGKVTPNLISSKNSDTKNEKIRNDFDNGLIQEIASFKKLQQGANLTDLDNVILMSYYSKQKFVIQRTGRLRQNGETGKIFVFVTENTQEKKWFDSMFEGMKKLNFIHCENVQECINKLNSKTNLFNKC